MKSRSYVLSIAGLLVACGGGTSSDGNGKHGCPSAPPKDGSACDLPQPSGFAGAQCSWGADRRPQCRTSALCSNGNWSVKDPQSSCADAPALPDTCPKTAEAATGDCTDPMLSCWYDDGSICHCSPCRGGSEYPLCQTIDPPQWACVKPDEACPNPLPQAGTSCDAAPELSCGASCELPIRCQDRVWQYGQEMCPICAAPDTPIATPRGERPISELAPGDLVYSVDETGIIVVPVLRAGSTPVANHRVVQVVLSDGTRLRLSPGHPTADGRTFAALLDGGALDAEHAVLSATLVPYTESRTFDILPGSPSGTYFAGGALIGSSLHR